MRNATTHALTASGLAVFILAATVVAHADQNSFLHHGRTSQVATKVTEYGDISSQITLNTRIPDSARVDNVVLVQVGTTVTATLTMDLPLPGGALTHHALSNCETGGGSDHPTCDGVREVNSCAWGDLTTPAKAALNTLLGSCTKQCLAVLDSPQFGEDSTTYRWSCAQANTAQCVVLAGIEGRVDLVATASGCQF